MGWRSKVVWSQGMFLLPQHFQQEARHVEWLIDARARCITPHGWGFGELVLAEAELAQGRIAIARAWGVLPDGTPFAMPELDALPPPLAIPADLRDERIVLALPLQREGQGEVAFDGDGAASPDAQAPRFHARTEAVVDNTDAPAEPEEIQTGALALRLVRERELGAAHAALGIAQVQRCRPDGFVQLERAYVPPQVRCDASGQLSAALTLLHGLVRRQAQALAESAGQLGHGVHEVADFLMLQLLNRHEPLLRDWAESPSLHPRTLFDTCLMLAGELGSFEPSRRAPELPRYRHDDLRGCFEPLFARLQALLSAVRERAAVPIPLIDRGQGLRQAVVAPPELARQAVFVLAVGAQLPGEQLRRRFPDVAKLGPADERFLVRLTKNLPGIVLRPLPSVPRELPLHAGFQYFELERGGEPWAQFEALGTLALHVAREETFPGLELQLWAIRT